MKHVRFFAILILAIILVNLYSYQSVYLTPYDNSYWRDLYDNSQWRVPNSHRTIGDELLYQVAAFDILKTGKIFDINPEVPPLGKYLYGLGIYFLGNAYYISLALFLISLIIYKHLCGEYLFSDTKAIYIALLLFTTDLLLLSQAGQTLLDLPQLLFLLIHVMFFRKAIKEKCYGYLIFSGIALGLMTSVKIGYISLVTLIIDSIYLIRSKKILDIPIMILMASLSYLALHLPYFLQGNSIYQFLKSELWVINFYLSSKAISPTNYGMTFIALASGFIRGWHNDNWSRIKEWSIMWPIYLISLFLIIIMYCRSPKIKQQYREIDYLISLTLCVLISFSIIPFFARYLVVVIPFLIIFFIIVYKNLRITKIFRYIFIALIIIIYFIQYINFIFPSPREFLTGVETIWQNSAYKDLYNSLDSESQKKITHRHFVKLLAAVEINEQTDGKTVSIEKIDTLPWQNIATTNILIKNQKTINTKLKLKREMNRWKIDWLNSEVSNYYK